MCLRPASFETGFGFVSGFDEGYSQGIFHKKKLTKLSLDLAGF